eukprot:CAMPEP_0117474430 /NCGR_PEP_ID=MMETSP0784-20121206/9280_1 /TAXON_ID=39447 /ORGANISM="" /LENGTH=191 /DNA_ID=CAMNT_0005268655 /DNA_START=273 /DNA_END=847 /DNA_ORIENTATION=+
MESQLTDNIGEHAAKQKYGDQAHRSGLLLDRTSKYIQAKQIPRQVPIVLVAENGGDQRKGLNLRRHDTSANLEKDVLQELEATQEQKQSGSRRPVRMSLCPGDVDCFQDPAEVRGHGAGSLHAGSVAATSGVRARDRDTSALEARDTEGMEVLRQGRSIDNHKHREKPRTSASRHALQQQKWRPTPWSKSA